jgi:hypothetical protein
MTQNTGWPKVKDLSRGASKLNAKDLSKLVHYIIIQEGGPPTTNQDIGGNVESIERMLESLYSVMVICMQI